MNWPLQGHLNVRAFHRCHSNSKGHGFQNCLTRVRGEDNSMGITLVQTESDIESALIVPRPKLTLGPAKNLSEDF